MVHGSILYIYTVALDMHMESRMRVYIRVVGGYEYSRTRRGGGRCVWREGGGWTETRLFHAYSLALYGSSLWRLDCPDLHSLNVSFNNVIRRIWNLPRNCCTLCRVDL